MEDNETAKQEESASSGQDFAWVKYALLTALCIGFTNFLLGDLSARLGVAGSFPIFYGILVMSLVYHLAVKDSFSVYFRPTSSDDLVSDETNDNY